MVKSGLEQPPKEYEVPRVSPYRLATHLSTAFAIYTALLWTTMDVFRPAPVLAVRACSPRNPKVFARSPVSPA